MSLLEIDDQGALAVLQVQQSTFEIGQAAIIGASIAGAELVAGNRSSR